MKNMFYPYKTDIQYNIQYHIEHNGSKTHG